MEYNCYIDESGDEGIGTGGTRWFILGALIVPAEDDLKVSEMVSRIKKRFQQSDSWTLHWIEQRKNHDRKLYICRELLTEGWTYTCVVADKQSPILLGATGLREKWRLYFYATRLLIERLSWFARDNGERKAKLIFEKRTNMSYEDLKVYLAKLKASKSETSISWDNVDCDGIQTFAKDKRRLLQACDCVCGAAHDALEYSPLGNLEPRYLRTFASRLYRRNGQVLSYGLKFLDADSNALELLKLEYEWLDTI